MTDTPVWPVEIDYGGIVPRAGDHLAIPVTVWADMCHLAGAASVSMADLPSVVRANVAVSQVYPVVRFHPTKNAHYPTTEEKS